MKGWVIKTSSVIEGLPQFVSGFRGSPDDPAILSCRPSDAILYLRRCDAVQARGSMNMVVEEVEAI